MARFFATCVSGALRLYPEEFRDHFGAAMRLTFDERLARHRTSHGRVRSACFAAGSICDIALHGLRERRLVRRREALTRSSRGDLMQALFQDIRFGVRVLAKAPGFTLVATLVLALGIGSTAAVFGIINTFMVKARPGTPDGDVVGVYSRERDQADSYRLLSYPEFADLRGAPSLFASLSAQTFGLAGLKQGDEVRRVFTGIVTSGFFETFGAPLALGRDFTLEEERPGADIPVAILSHDLWMTLGGRPDLVGSTIAINARAFTVVGVARRGFTGSAVLFGPNLWVPTGVYGSIAFLVPNQGGSPAERSSHSLMLVGRLPKERPVESVAARLGAVAADLERAYPADHVSQAYQVAPLSRLSIGNSPQDESAVTGVMVVLLVLAGVVMLISALNVANMLIARADVRRREVAVRIAVGGTRWRILRQLVTEGLLLATAGGIAGVLLATWVNGVFLGAIATSVSAVMPAAINLDATPNGFVLAMTCLASLVCTLAFSVGPAWRMVRRDTQAALGESAVVSVRPRGRWVSSALVTGQVALSLMLLTVAGLFVRMSVSWAQADPGFTLSRGILINVDPALAGYDLARSRATLAPLLERLRQVPGVEAAGVSSLVPFGPMNLSLRIARAGSAAAPGEPGSDDGSVDAVWTSTSSGYFDSLGLSMTAGREFTSAEDRDANPLVAIIDRAAADRLFPNQNPIGQFVEYTGANPNVPVVLEVVGLAPPIRHQVFDAAPDPHVYMPYMRESASNVFLHVRTAAPSPEAEAAMVHTLRRALLEVDPQLPILSMQTLPMYRDQSVILSMLRLGAGTFIGFGLMALFMATIGVYGVKAYLVASRTREISIRVTLGAQRRDVLWMMLRQGLGVAATGVAIGLGLSLAMGAAVQGVVLTGGAFDLPVFAAASGLLVLAVLVASWLPARRATRVPATSFMRG